MRTPTRKAIETKIGLIIVFTSNVVPSEVITLTMISPKTSSTRAAEMSTVPTLVEPNFAAESVAKVVPNEVDERAAPAENAAIFVTCDGNRRGRKRNEKAIGNVIPVTAIMIEVKSVSLNKFSFVVSPPEEKMD